MTSDGAVERKEPLRVEAGKSMTTELARAYELLGVAPGSDRAVARRAYRRLALAHHPDMGGDAGKFASIHSAWELIRRSAELGPPVGSRPDRVPRPTPPQSGGVRDREVLRRSTADDHGVRTAYTSWRAYTAPVVHLHREPRRRVAARGAPSRFADVLNRELRRFATANA